jgi:hypothetical protein
MANFTPSQAIIDFLVSSDEEAMKTIVDGVSPSDMIDPVNKPLGFNTIYGTSDGTMVVSPIVGSVGQYDIPVDAISLSLGNGVTSIGNGAFQFYSDLTGSLTIPNSVVNIGNGAFQFCAGFTGALAIGDSVTTIEDGAFQLCSGFAGALTIGDSVTSIGFNAFAYCSGLTGSLALPSGLASVGHYAFYQCLSLGPDLIIPDSVTFIGNFAFYQCIGITNVNCYTTRTVFDVLKTIDGTSVTTIHARASDNTWTAGVFTIGGQGGVTVIKDL